MERRTFLRNAGKLAGGVALTATALSAKPEALIEAIEVNPGQVPKRRLLRDGAALSIVGFPGLHLRYCNQAESNDTIRKAMDEGVNYIDVAPAYGSDGECEIKMGGALQGINRDKVFLSCKTRERSAEGARMELERSLKRLKTDHFDLYQMHVLHTPGEVEQAFGPGGCMEVIEKAKKAGKIRRVGFSAHTSIAAMEAMNAYAFDTVMFPINFVEHFSFGFGQAVLEKAQAQKVSVITIKSTSAGGWPDSVDRKDREYWYQQFADDEKLSLAMRFALSQPNVITAIPAAHEDNFQRTVNVAKSFRPIDKEGMHELLEMAKKTESLFLTRQSRGLALHHHHHDDDPDYEMC